MKRIEILWLGLCSAFATGIGIALMNPRLSELWPIALGCGVLVVMLGFGFAVRVWPWLLMGLLGLALTWQSVVGAERHYRESPWMRSSMRRASSVRAEISPVKSDLLRRVGIGVDASPEMVLLNQAILLGERRRLPPQLKRVFVDSGAIHVFAISGLHVMVVAKILMVFVAFCFVSYRWQGIVSLPFLWGYIVLIGSPPSAVRAGLMASFYFCAPVVWRRPNGLIAWSLAFLTIHLIAPQQLGEVRSIFSFVVMLVLILADRAARQVKCTMAKFLFLNFCAWAAGVPIAAAAFGRLSVAGLVSNLVLVATAVHTVVWGFLGLLTSYFCVPLALHLNSLSILVTKAMVGVATATASMPYATVNVSHWSVWECGGWYLALGLTFFLLYRITARRGRL